MASAERKFASIEKIKNITDKKLISGKNAL